MKTFKQLTLKFLAVLLFAVFGILFTSVIVKCVLMYANF